MHNSSKFRGPSPTGDTSSSNRRIEDKDLKKIKVRIHRKISNPEPDKEVDRSIENPEKLNILRHKGEGKKPIFERNDIIVNKEIEQGTEREVHSRSPRREHFSPRREVVRRDAGRSRSPRRTSRSSRSPRRDRSISPRRPSSSRYSSSSRRSRSHDRVRRSRHRSRSRSITPRRRIDHRYDHVSRHSRERRYRRSRSLSPRRNRYGPSEILDPLAVPLVHLYGPAEYWLPSLRPPPIMARMLPPRGLYRPPMMGGLRPPMPRPPFIPLGQPRPPLPNIIRPRPPRE